MALAVAVVVAAAFATLAGAEMRLVTLPQAVTTHGARCLDGSPAAYYLQEASRAQDATKWVLYFESGGWCYSPIDCAARSRTEHGSSALQPPTVNNTPYGVISDSRAANPDFYGWNHVSLVYCDGASFAGSAAQPLVVGNGTKLFFRGLANLRAIVDDLLANRGLDRATEVLLAGASAGGLSAFIHADRVAALLPASVKRYKVAPMSGVFLRHRTVLDKDVYEAQMKEVFRMHSTADALPLSCLKAHATQQHRCLFAEDLMEHVDAPLFVLNSIYDFWDLSCIFTAEPVRSGSDENGNCSAVPGWAQCLSPPHECTPEQLALMDEPWGSEYRAMLATRTALKRRGSGLFAYSCVYHGGEVLGNKFVTVHVNGTRMSSALGKWWRSSNEDAAKHTYVDCLLNGNFQCNPTCTSTKQQDINSISKF